MTVPVRLADAPSGSKCQKISDAYRKGCYGKFMHNSRVFRQEMAFGMLEPCAGKLACTVLRGLGGVDPFLTEKYH